MPPNLIPFPFGIAFPAFGLGFPPPRFLPLKKSPTNPAASKAPLAKLDSKLPAEPKVAATFKLDNF